MVEWLILLESKLQPERMSVGDALHIRRALRDLQVKRKGRKEREREGERERERDRERERERERGGEGGREGGTEGQREGRRDGERERETEREREREREEKVKKTPSLSQVIEAELKSKESEYKNFMKEIETETETESRWTDSMSTTPVPDPSDLNSPMGFKFLDENSLERRRHRREIRSAIGMESVRERSVEEEEEEEEGRSRTPSATDGMSYSNQSTPLHSLSGAMAAARVQRSGSMGPD